MAHHVDVRGVCKEFHGRLVLDKISFSIEYGAFFAIIGPNGAGKTTLLRILDLLEEPTSGEVWLDGERVNYARRDLHLLRRWIGFVPQRPVLFNASVFDNVAYGLRVRGLSTAEIRERVKRALEMVQLGGLEGRNALKLSGGEAQRVSLAQALAAEPRLLLLDEPTANLDPRSTSIIEETLLHMNRGRGVTVIMASHDIRQVESLAQRVAILSNGRLIKTGSLSEVLRGSPEEISGYVRLENVFSGMSRLTEYGTSIIKVNGGLEIEAAFLKSGEVRVYVPPESITVLAGMVPTSARNIFEGVISRIIDYGHIVELRVGVKGGREFAVQITRKSLEEMRLGVGSKVFIAFKASSVRLL